MCRHLSLQGLWDKPGGSLSRETCVSLESETKVSLEVRIQELRGV